MLDQKNSYENDHKMMMKMAILNSGNLNHNQICHFICNGNELTDFYIDGIFALSGLSEHDRVPLRKTLNKNEVFP